MIKTPQWSPREIQVIERLCHGESNKQIAWQLQMSDATVKVHLKALMRKAGVHDRLKVTLLAIGMGFTNHVALEAAEEESVRKERLAAAERQRQLNKEAVDNYPLMG